jgi:hypothetical protein
MKWLDFKQFIKEMFFMTWKDDLNEIKAAISELKAIVHAPVTPAPAANDETILTAIAHAQVGIDTLLAETKPAGTAQ